MPSNNSNISSSNTFYLYNKYWFAIGILLYVMYIIPLYTLFVLSITIILFINIYYPELIVSYKTLLLEYIEKICLGYLGDGPFDPLPKSK
jgi:hypothetical protein